MAFNDWQLSLTDVEALGLTLIGEARGEPIEGIVAVGSIIRNRLISYKSYITIVFTPKQFSCWNTNDPNYSMLKDLAFKMITGQKLTDAYHRQCLWVANGIFIGDIISNVGNRIYYMSKVAFDKRLTDGMSWDDKPVNPIQIGNQIYFNV